MPGQPDEATVLREQLLGELTRMDAVIQTADSSPDDPLMRLAATEAREVRGRVLASLDQLDQRDIDRLMPLVLDDPAVQAAQDQLHAAAAGPPPGLDPETWQRGRADALGRVTDLAVRRFADARGIPDSELPHVLDIASRLLEQPDDSPDPSHRPPTKDQNDMAKKRPARRCTGHRSSDGQPCEAWAVAGATVCSAHGGRAPQVRAAAQERLAIEKAVARFGLDLDGTPVDEIALREIRRSSAMVQHLSLLVSQVPEADLTRGTARRVRQDANGQTVEIHQRDRVHPLVHMLDQERRQLRDWLVTAHQCGIAERRTRLAELEGALMANLIRAILFDPELEMRPEQIARFAVVVPRHLRALDHETPP